MLPLSSIERRVVGVTGSASAMRVALVIVALTCALATPRATAQTIDISLNVMFTTPYNIQSGGTWQLVAKSPGSQGLSALDVYLSGVNIPPPQPVGPRGTVNGTDPAGFSEFDAFNVLAGVTEIVIGQNPVNPDLEGSDEEAIFYGVGTLTNGAPNYPGKPGGSNSIGPSFTSLTGVSGVPWATGDVFGNATWNTAAVLAAGSFAPGSMPAFYQDVSFDSRGQVFNSLPATSKEIGNLVEITPANTSTVVRTNQIGSPDYNHNGVVDVADYVVWRKTFGHTGQDADGNLNGLIDEGDYGIWRAYFGKSVPLGPGAGAGGSGLGSGLGVPEPATGTLLTGAAGILFLRRRFRVLRNVSVL